MKSPKNNRSITLSQLATYQSYGFDVVHNHIVNINPLGERIEVDFSATDPDFIVQVAIKKAYEEGQRAGQEALQAKMRSLLGVELPVLD